MDYMDVLGMIGLVIAFGPLVIASTGLLLYDWWRRKGDGAGGQGHTDTILRPAGGREGSEAADLSLGGPDRPSEHSLRFCHRDEKGWDHWADQDHRLSDTGVLPEDGPASEKEGGHGGDTAAPDGNAE